MPIETGNIKKTDASVEEMFNRHLIGGIQRCRGQPARPHRLPRQLKAGEAVRVRLFERHAGQRIQAERFWLPVQPIRPG